MTSPGAGACRSLHETLLHPELPRIELHWRVHWYERQFAADAVARAAKPAADAPLEMQPMDGLIALMLFYARDGFAGLRYPADAAAWWDARCAGSDGPGPAELVADRYPSLVAPVSVAAYLLLERSRACPRSRGVTCRSAGASPPVWRARFSKADGGRPKPTPASPTFCWRLRAPPETRSAACWATRLITRRTARRTGSTRWRATWAHVLRVARRWAVAVVPAVVRGYALGRPTDR